MLLKGTLSKSQLLKGMLLKSMLLKSTLSKDTPRVRGDDRLKHSLPRCLSVARSVQDIAM